MEVEIKHTVVFSKNLNAYNSGRRFIINQGGARSSKTYSIIQLLIYLCLIEHKLKVSIVRKSFPSLRGSVLRDFVEIMMDLNLYKESNHNKTEQVYTFQNRSSIEFFSIDDAQKVRGRKRDICYCNESNELNFDDFQQLSLRTNKTFIIDFNPSDDVHWLYDLIKDDRSILIKSNYKDNIYLSNEIITEIENLINVDNNYYLIYALGERPVTTTRIYTHFKQYVDEPKYTDWCYGLDFGYNHPAVLVKIMYFEDKIYIRELIYESKLIISDLVSKVKELIKDNNKIYCDSARPDIIEELRQNGLQSVSSIKDVREGIDYIKSQQIYIHNESENLLREYKLYMWKSKGDQILDEPIKLNDDGMDAIRYGIFTHKKKKFNEFYTRVFF